MTLRPARAQDAPLLRAGDEQPHVLASDPNDDWAWETQFGRDDARAIRCCFADPSVVAILVDSLASNARAHRFYERLGFRFVERRHFGADECFVYRLERALQL